MMRAASNTVVNENNKITILRSKRPSAGVVSKALYVELGPFSDDTINDSRMVMPKV